MAYSDSGESFFANSNFEFVNDKNQSSNRSLRPDANSLSITLWNREVRLGETIDGLVKLGVGDHLAEGHIYLHFTVRQRSQYVVSSSKKVSRNFNLGLTSGLVNTPRNLVVKEDRVTYEDITNSKQSLVETEKADSDEKAKLWGDDESDKMSNTNDGVKRPLENLNGGLNGLPTHMSLVGKNQVKPVDQNFKSGNLNAIYNKSGRLINFSHDRGEAHSLNNKYLEESILHALNNPTVVKPLARTGQDLNCTQDGSTVLFEKLIKVFSLNNPINKPSLLFVPFRIDLKDCKDLLCSANVHFELSDSSDNVKISGGHDYFQLSLIHNLRFAYIPTEAIKRHCGPKTLSLDSRAEVDLTTFKTLLANSRSDPNLIVDDTDFNLVPNMDGKDKSVLLDKIRLWTRVTRLLCFPIRMSFKVSIGIDRTVINDQTQHLNVAFSYPVCMIGVFNYLELTLLMKFSSKVSTGVFKELVVLCEHVDLHTRHITRKTKYLEFAHKFSLAELKNSNFHTVQVS